TKKRQSMKVERGLRTHAAFFFIFCIPAIPSLLAQPAGSAAAAQRAVLDKYCIVCHNQRAKTAGLMLDQAGLNNPPANAEVWEKVIRRLRAGTMPPLGMPRP